DSHAYISQCEDYVGTIYDSKIRSVLKAPEEYDDYLSGGEKVKFRITEALSENKKLIIADEPTSNLDRGTIKVLEDMFKAHRGAMLLVSHDREFLDALCNGIVEIEDGKLKFYKGNYSKYVELKAEEKERQRREYDGYTAEKHRLEEAIFVKQGLRDGIRKAPRRFGNSEARLCKMGDQKAKQNLDGNIKALKSRIDHLETKEKPKNEGRINIRVSEGKEIVSKNVIEVKELSIKAGSRTLLDGVSLKVKRGKKTALLGENGIGKTTLLKSILQGDKIQQGNIEISGDIRVNNKVVVGYFDQSQDILKEDKSILENIMEESAYDQSFIRINLDGFGFKGDTVHKKVVALSGGERVKVALCKILLGDNNVLVLDEPTNYLDIKSMEALETALNTTDKTVLIVSHDRKFISNVCDYILEIEEEKVKEFNGTYEEYLKEKNKPVVEAVVKINRDQLMVLENRLSEVISILSIENNEKKKEEKLEEYNILLKQVSELRKIVR
ncbi:MAG: ABC-F family ATP-binding cassette domain-containing protein, partial [Clostridium sp.]